MITGTVIIDDNLHFLIAFPCPDGHRQRPAFRIHSMLDRIFHQRLHGQGRDQEMDMRQIKYDYELIPESGLLDSKIGPCMLHLFLKGDHLRPDNRAEDISKINRKIPHNFLCLFAVGIYQVINAGQRVIDKMRTHLQNPDFEFLLCISFFLLQILVQLILDNLDEHHQGPQNDANGNRQDSLIKCLDDSAQERRQQHPGHGDTLPSAHFPAAPQQPQAVEQQCQKRRNQQKRIQRPALIIPCQINRVKDWAE